LASRCDNRFFLKAAAAEQDSKKIRFVFRPPIFQSLATESRVQRALPSLAFYIQSHLGTVFFCSKLIFLNSADLI